MAENSDEIQVLDNNHVNNDIVERIVKKLNDSELNSIFFLLMDRSFSSIDYLIIMEQNRSFKERCLKPLLSGCANLLIDLLWSLKRYDLLKIFDICPHDIQHHFSSLSKLWKSLYEVCDNYEKERDLKYFKKVFTEVPISNDELSEWSIVKACDDKLVLRKDLVALLNDLNKSNQVSKTWTLRSEYYAVRLPTKKLPCGLAIIVNHENFTSEVKDKLSLRRREDSQLDVDALKKLWQSYGFKVLTYLDYKANDILLKFEELSKMDLSSYDVFVTCYMSHGDQGVVYSSDSQPIPISRLIDFMANKCKTLMNKPKLFFIEACQGTRFQCGNTIPVLSLPSDSNSNSAEHLNVTPLFVDVFVAISSIPGFASFASKGKNSWFIEALVQNMEQYGDKLSISEVMTKVNSHVYEKHGCTDVLGQLIKNCRQTVVHTNTLTKLLKLKKLCSS